MGKVFGIAFNDVDGSTGSKVYSSWANMIKRCNYDSWRPSYSDCNVCDEWLTYSNFYDWAKDRYIEGYHLDKDIKIPGNKIYSPDACMYVPMIVNQFFVDSSKNGLKQGVHKLNGERLKRRFSSKISNPITGCREYLGVFFSEDDAHSAWLKRKIEIAKMIADMVDGEELKTAIKNFYGSNKESSNIS